MGHTVLYIPVHQQTEAELWEKIRIWQKDKSIAWERIRVTPDFYHSSGLQREEMQAMLDMVRQGLVDRVVYASLEDGRTRDLDWLAFALSLQKYNVVVESFQDGALDISKALQQLTSGFQSMHAPL